MCQGLVLCLVENDKQGLLPNSGVLKSVYHSPFKLRVKGTDCCL